MGSNTPFLDLFKFDGSDVVDLEADFNGNSDKIDAWAQAQSFANLSEISNGTELPDVDGTYFIHGAGFGSPTVTLPTTTVMGRRITVIQVDEAAECFVNAPSGSAFVLSGQQVPVVYVMQFLSLGAIYPPDQTTDWFWAALLFPVP